MKRTKMSFMRYLCNIEKTNVMDLQADRNWIVSEIMKVKDPELITAFKSLLRYRAKQNQENLVDDLPIQVQESIQRGIEQARKGEMRHNSEVKKKYEKWL